MSEAKEVYEEKPSQDVTIHTPTEAERKTGRIAWATAGVIGLAGFTKFSFATDFIEFVREAEPGNLLGSLFYGAAAVSAATYGFLVSNSSVREHDNEARRNNDLMSHKRSDSFKRKSAATAFVLSVVAAGAQETGAINSVPGFSSGDTENIDSGDATADRIQAEPSILPEFSVGQCEIITPIIGTSDTAVDSMGRLQWGLSEAGYPNDMTGFQQDGTTNQALGDFKNDYGFSGSFNADMCDVLDGLVGNVLSDGLADTPSSILDLGIYQG